MSERAPRYVAGVVHYRDADSVLRLARESAHWALPPSGVLIADNSGEFEDPQLLSSLPGEASVLSMGSNRGYAGAVNRLLHAARELGATCLLVLTQDARLDRLASAKLFEAVIAGAAVAAPLLALSTDPERVFSAGGVLAKDARTSHQRSGEKITDVERPDQAYAVDWGDGACLMISVESALAIGGFDEAYFLYVEEVDFQLRARNAGMRVVLVPSALAFQSPGDYSLYYKYRNLCYFSSKYPGQLKCFPWYRTWWSDTVRVVLRSRRLTEPFWALRGVADYRWGRMGGPKPARLIEWAGRH